ncbi:MAG: cyclic nucleotide-binding domain-containing protein [Desulfobacteraceae bacterium]|nr:cyclic nucleotide-binding domain-containing protein [Desulfobacteraceae bacterium]
MRTKILSLLKIYKEEVSLLLWTTALLFIIRSSGMILNNYAETTFLKRYGVEYLPIVNMLNAVITFFITGFLTTFIGKISGARLLSWIFIISGISVTIIRLLIPFGSDLLYPLLFMLKSQFELLQALLFWNLCNDLFNMRQSKRLFPLLTAGGVIGLIIGGFTTPYFAKTFNLDNMLYLYLATTLMGACIVQAMGRNYSTPIFTGKQDLPKEKRSSMIQEFKNVLPLIKDSMLIKIVLILTFMPNVVIPIINYQFNYAINNQFASEAAMIQFLGYFRGILNTVSLIILLFVGRIYGRWGLPVALMFHPINYMIAFLAFFFRFDIFSAIYARMSTTIIRTTINVPSNSILIGLFPESYRNMIRPFLRGTVARLALFTGSTLILISTSFFPPRYLTLVALPFVLAWMAGPIILKFKYSTILKGLISKNLLDIKSLDQDELKSIFNQDKILSDLETSFLSAKGKDAIWYAKLLKNFSARQLDTHILNNLEKQDQQTQLSLIKMISPPSRTDAAKKLIHFLDPEKPEVTIAILKLVRQNDLTAIRGVDLTPFIENNHPVVRGFAAACLYSRNPQRYRSLIETWLKAKQMDHRQSGIIGAGLSNDRQYITTLLTILSEKNIDPIIPDIIRALSRLKAKQLNTIIFAYLSYGHQDIRIAALDALEINDDFFLKKAILLLGDNNDSIHEFAMEKIRTANYQNNRVLIESLGMPSGRIRRGLFKLLETLDIKEFEILMFTKENLKKSYTYLAMEENLSHLPRGDMRDLAIEHLSQKKDLVLENIIRVLAIRDQTGRMKTAWRGIFSQDTRQRANAIELLSDILDRKTFNAMLPLLESPTPQIALADGKKVIKIVQLDPEGKKTLSNLLESEDWVDVIMGLSLVHENPVIYEANKMLKELENSINKHILKEVQMILNKPEESSKNPQRIHSTEIPLGKKILLLKEIEIFSGLSAAELAAIAAVTKELDYPEGRTVIKQNNIGETVFLIIKGRVEVIMEQENDKEIMLDHIESGGAFGEMALIDNAPRSATIRTIEPSQFLILHKQEFKETAMEFPRIALKICAVLSQYIRDLHGKIPRQIQ